eukprot:7312513-Lingulodinium_polyedra.AAC.1
MPRLPGAQPSSRAPPANEGGTPAGWHAAAAPRAVGAAGGVTREVRDPPPTLRLFGVAYDALG